jgi:hypothetical protein
MGNSQFIVEVIKLFFNWNWFALNESATFRIVHIYRHLHLLNPATL